MKNMTFGDFPVSESAVFEALQALVKQFRARYTSRFTMVAVLPQAIWTAKKLEEIFDAEGAPFHLTGLGIMRTEKEGKRGYVVVEPPSHHSIFGKKVIIFSAFEPWDIMLAAGNFIKEMRPQSIEMAALFARGEMPEWINPDYVAFQVSENILVTGLGLGYNEEHSMGGSLTAEEVKQDAPPVETSEETTGGESLAI